MAKAIMKIWITLSLTKSSKSCRCLQNYKFGEEIHQNVSLASQQLSQQVATQISGALLLEQSRKINTLYRKLEQHTGLNIELLVVEWLTGFIQD